MFLTLLNQFCQGQNSSQGSSNEVCGFIYTLLLRQASWSPYYYLFELPVLCHVSSPSPYCLQMNSLPQGVPLNICPSRIPLTSWMPCLVRASPVSSPTEDVPPLLGKKGESGESVRKEGPFCPFRPPSSFHHSLAFVHPASSPSLATSLRC